MPRTSPTQRSLKYLREQGLVVGVVEKWIEARKIRQDLFGWIDIIALDPTDGTILAVQTTSGDNTSKRLNKIREWPHLAAFLRRNRAEVHGWAKRGPRGKRKVWTVRVIPLEA